VSEKNTDPRREQGLTHLKKWPLNKVSAAGIRQRTSKLKETTDMSINYYVWSKLWTQNSTLETHM